MSRPKVTLPSYPGLIALTVGIVLMFTWWPAIAVPATPYVGIALFVGGAYWLWLAGWRTIAQGLFFVATLLSVGLKLFTAELDDPSDPETAVIVKSGPSLRSIVKPGEAAAATPYLYVIKPHEERYVGVRLYRALVRAGWIAAPVVWLFGLLTWRPLALRFNLDVPIPPLRRRRGTRLGRKRPLKRWGLMVAGYTFLVLGVLGLFLPILQGILFLVIGFLFLARVSPRVRLARLKLRARYPEWAARYDVWERQAKDWLKGRFKRKGRKPRSGKARRPASKASDR